jgi:hypothetical protein
MAKSKDSNEQLVFQKELDELLKIQKKAKAEFLASMEIPNAVPLEVGYRVPIKESKATSVQEEPAKIHNTPKTYEDFFGPKFHERYSYDFLKLKDIDGKPISREGTGQASEQAETSMGKVKFVLGGEEKTVKVSQPIRMKSILKKKQSPSMAFQTQIDTASLEKEEHHNKPDLSPKSSKVTYDELD